jgi:pseudouridine-5'-phosphate glycosidase/pseudouridine kinase
MEWITREGIVQKAIGCLPWMESIWIKSGAKGLLHVRITMIPPPGGSVMQELEGVHQGKYLAVTHHPATVIPVDEVVSTTGAGDTLVGGLVAGLVSSEGEREDLWVSRAMERVGRTIRSRRAVG